MLLKYDPHNFRVRRDRSFISPYFDDPDDSSATILVTPRAINICAIDNSFSHNSTEAKLSLLPSKKNSGPFVRNSGSLRLTAAKA